MKSVRYTLITAILALSTTSIVANTGIHKFTTEQEAAQHCPNPNQLTFTPASTIITKKGKITGTQNAKSFVSFALSGSPYAPRPKDLSFGNILAVAHFRMANGFYGYTSGTKTTCLYSYQTFSSQNYPLKLRD